MERGITVKIEPGMPVVYGDRPRLVEVMQNLLDNASKFMGGQKEPSIEWVKWGRPQSVAGRSSLCVIMESALPRSI
jgi:signal transduction histidine kinase